MPKPIRPVRFADKLRDDARLSNAAYLACLQLAANAAWQIEAQTSRSPDEPQRNAKSTEGPSRPGQSCGGCTSAEAWSIWSGRVTPAPTFPPLLPPRRQRSLQLLQHHPLVRPSSQDRLGDFWREQQRQDLTDSATGTHLGWARVTVLSDMPLNRP
jgi:hypothetical protein